MINKKNEKGFTLAEILIALAISGVLLGAIVAVFNTQKKNYTVQDQVSEMQQNARIAMYFLQRELRMIGYDPTDAGLFDFVDIGYVDIRNASPYDTAPTQGYVDPGSPHSAGGYGYLRFQSDFDEDGVLDGDEEISYRLYDFIQNDNQFDLGRNEGGGLQLLAENIEAIGFAFAYDSNNDGRPETYNAGGNDQIIWAYDSNGDNTLDKNMDTGLNGIIDENDADTATDPLTDGQSIIDNNQNIGPITMDQIYAVRIWLLCKSDRQTKDFLSQETYTVGRHVIQPRNIVDEQNNGGFRRFLLESTVVVRNKAL